MWLQMECIISKMFGQHKWKTPSPFAFAKWNKEMENRIALPRWIKIHDNAYVVRGMRYEYPLLCELYEEHQKYTHFVVFFFLFCFLSDVAFHSNASALAYYIMVYVFGISQTKSELAVFYKSLCNNVGIYSCRSYFRFSTTTRILRCRVG